MTSSVGVEGFTTYTRLNAGLRLQRGPELDGDLERELHHNRAQLDAHPLHCPQDGGVHNAQS